MIKKYKSLVIVYCLFITCLAIYSYSQVDLNLTLNQSPFYLSFQQRLTNLGYLHRPFSTSIFVFLIFSFLISHFSFLHLVKKKALGVKQVFFLIALTTALLLLSYPAFSHDIFNYIFDAKVVWTYKQNPWKKSPFEFFGDPMLRFMRWVHRPSVYPPGWVGLSLPVVIFAFDKFILQLFLMKFLIALFHLGTAFLIFRILGKIAPKKQLLGTVLFAFSPVVIIENLISPHNDIAMSFFALLSIYLFLKKKWTFSFLSLLFSIGIKYVTAVFLPFWVLGYFLNKKGVKIDFALVFRFLAWVSLFVFAVFVFKFEFQPWYLMWVIPFAALAIEDKVLVGLTTALSIAALLRYAPFLYYGHYDPPVPRIKLCLTIIPIGVWIFLLKIQPFLSAHKLKKIFNREAEKKKNFC